MHHDAADVDTEDKEGIEGPQCGWSWRGRSGEIGRLAKEYSKLVIKCAIRGRYGMARFPWYCIQVVFKLCLQNELSVATRLSYTSEWTYNGPPLQYCSIARHSLIHMNIIDSPRRLWLLGYLK